MGQWVQAQVPSVPLLTSGERQIRQHTLRRRLPAVIPPDMAIPDGIELVGGICLPSIPAGYWAMQVNAYGVCEVAELQRIPPKIPPQWDSGYRPKSRHGKPRRDMLQSPQSHGLRPAKDRSRPACARRANRL